MAKKRPPLLRDPCGHRFPRSDTSVVAPPGVSKRSGRSAPGCTEARSKSAGSASAAADDFANRLGVVALRGVAIALPPVEAADQLPYLKAQHEQPSARSWWRRCNRPVAVAGVGPGPVQLGRRVGVDAPVGQAQRARYVLQRIGLGRPAIDHGQRFAVTQCLVDIPQSISKSSLLL